MREGEAAEGEGTGTALWMGCVGRHVVGTVIGVTRLSGSAWREGGMSGCTWGVVGLCAWVGRLCWGGCRPLGTGVWAGEVCWGHGWVGSVAGGGGGVGGVGGGVDAVLVGVDLVPSGAVDVVVLLTVVDGAVPVPAVLFGVDPVLVDVVDVVPLAAADVVLDDAVLVPAVLVNVVLLAAAVLGDAVLDPADYVPLSALVMPADILALLLASQPARTQPVNWTRAAVHSHAVLLC